MSGDGYLGDVWYEVWCRGGSVDDVDDDRVEDSRYDGLDYEEAAARELRHQRDRSEFDVDQH